PSLLHSPTAHRTTPTNSTAWFNTHYKAAIGPLLMGADHELSSDVVQCWLTLQGPPSGVQLQAIIQQLFNVLQALTADVWDPSHCRTCAVVGNSGQLKGSSHGLLIYAHDWVLSWKRSVLSISTVTFVYPESAVNLRTDVHLDLVPFKPLEPQWVTSAFSTRELTRCHGEQLITPLSTQVLILSLAFPKYIHKNWTQHHGRYPSTGFTALLFALHTCQQVSLFGFGADSEGNWHHYWEKNHWSRAFCRIRVHDADVEFSLLGRRALEGRIVFYK
ncbi:SIA4B sialyltransferase, partial [Chloropsis hardwickii]|nr:SIA4B sialyltransferase [Chloropsis hardwickii]